jgi:ribosome-associated translation inhibitor RaiA
MNIQIKTDHNIQGNKALINKFSSIIKSALIRLSDHITSIQVHLSDENGDKSGKNDKRCMIEARLEGRHPIVVIDHQETLNQALDGAVDKLIRMIESILGRQRNQRIRKTEQSPFEEKFTEEK